MKKLRGEREFHGLTGTPEYHAWESIRQRCWNPNDKRYPDYGGRGITVDPAWDNFTQFLADMGIRPDGTSLDRIDNDGPYSPANCRWATAAEQAANKRPRKLRDACGKGHEYTPENTYIRTAGDGRRQCRTCNAAAARRYKERQAA